MKTQVAQRVIIMGLEGSARNQLVSALSEHGVMPLWVGRPAQTNPDQIADYNPNKVIISLEPSIESDLEPYSDFLSRSTVSVLYDDAEITRSLSGWDLNRWARHLAAKLLGKELLPESSKTPDAIDESDALDFSIDWDSGSESGPVDELLNKVSDAPHHAVSHDAWLDTGHYDELEIDSDELNSALEKMNASLTNDAAQDESPEAMQLMSFEGGSEVEPSAHDADAVRVNASNLTTHLDFVTDYGRADEYVSTEGLSEEQAKADRDAILRELTNQVADIPRFDLSKYALVDNESAAGNANWQDDQAENDRSDSDLKPLLLVISGLGGPAAIRKLLGLIKENFAKIIVVSHEIDAPQLPKLRDQLQKITKIPMLLPVTDEFLKNGNIYILNKKQTIQGTSLGYQCIAGQSLSGYILKMDHDADIAVLSGADELLSQPLIQVSSLLNNIHVQAPDECFEPALAQLLVNIGAPLLDNDVLEHWFN